ncbi:hypothetical protein ACXZ1K_11545 [Pedobacter sp. PWIIR3]
MKRRVIYLMLTTVILLCTNIANTYAQFPVYGNSQKLKGKVKSFVETCYDTSFGNKTLVVKRNFIFDANGVLQQCIIYDTIDSNKIQDTIKYQYENKLLMQETAKEFVIRYLYDDKGNLSAKRYRSGTVNYLHRFVYNKENQMLEAVSYNNKNKLIFRDNFKYDDQNNMIGRSHFVADSLSESFNAAYTYDLQHNRFSERVYALTGYVLYFSKFWHDSDNNLVSDWRYNASGSFERRKEYTYLKDQFGNWINMVTKSKKNTFLTTRTIQYQSN